MARTKFKKTTVKHQPFTSKEKSPRLQLTIKKKYTNFDKLSIMPITSTFEEDFGETPSPAPKKSPCLIDIFS